MERVPALLALEDGSVWPGFSCGAAGSAVGEFVFNTAMTGYQEVLTDPSYKNQIVVMTYPLIGNYGIIAKDDESERPVLSGLVVRELCRKPSNWEMTETLEAFLKRNGVVAIEGINTRALTRLLRDKGALRGVISTEEKNPALLKRRAKEVRSMIGAKLAEEVSCREKYVWRSAGQTATSFPEAVKHAPALQAKAGSLNIIAYDFGIKRGILRSLSALGFRVTVVPALTSAQETLALNPDGIVFSNGPGDPESLREIIEMTKRLLDSGKPLFGICLGHQLLALALGAKTYKLKFGHHGSNHPVIDIETRKVEITSQNHGFSVDASTLPDCAAITHLSLNDNSCEGLSHKQIPAFSLQYHPEASAGPHDSLRYFERFKQMILSKSARPF
jgi:carbamoyl-phosphate synthase small subunit